MRVSAFTMNKEERQASEAMNAKTKTDTEYMYDEHGPADLFKVQVVGKCQFDHEIGAGHGAVGCHLFFWEY